MAPISKLVEGSRLVEGFNDGSNDGNELVEGSIDDDGTWLVEGSNDGSKLTLGELDGAHQSGQKLPGVLLYSLSPNI